MIVRDSSEFKNLLLVIFSQKSRVGPCEARQWACVRCISVVYVGFVAQYVDLNILHRLSHSFHAGSSGKSSDSSGLSSSEGEKSKHKNRTPSGPGVPVGPGSGPLPAPAAARMVAVPNQPIDGGSGNSPGGQQNGSAAAQPNQGGLGGLGSPIQPQGPQGSNNSGQAPLISAPPPVYGVFPPTYQAIGTLLFLENVPTSLLSSLFFKIFFFLV